MTRVQIWHTIPDGYELACADLRFPKAGEWYLNREHVACLATVDQDVERVIVRKVWEWPPWLLCEWVARNADGTLTMGVGNYRLGPFAIYATATGCGLIVPLSMLAINLPLTSDWRQSMRMNPKKTVVTQ